MTANFGECLERAHLLLGDPRLEKSQKANVLSAMGAGRVLNPAMLKVPDISKTHHSKISEIH